MVNDYPPLLLLIFDATMSLPSKRPAACLSSSDDSSSDEENGRHRRSWKSLKSGRPEASGGANRPVGLATVRLQHHIVVPEDVDSFLDKISHYSLYKFHATLMMHFEVSGSDEFEMKMDTIQLWRVKRILLRELETRIYLDVVVSWTPESASPH